MRDIQFAGEFWELFSLLRGWFGTGYAHLDWTAGSLADTWVRVAAATARMKVVRIFVIGYGIF